MSLNMRVKTVTTQLDQNMYLTLSFHQKVQDFATFADAWQAEASWLPSTETNQEVTW